MRAMALASLGHVIILGNCPFFSLVPLTMASMMLGWSEPRFTKQWVTPASHSASKKANDVVYILFEASEAVESDRALPRLDSPLLVKDAGTAKWREDLCVLEGTDCSCWLPCSRPSTLGALFAYPRWLLSRVPGASDVAAQPTRGGCRHRTWARRRGGDSGVVLGRRIFSNCTIESGLGSAWGWLLTPVPSPSADVSASCSGNPRRVVAGYRSLNCRRMPGLGDGDGSVEGRRLGSSVNSCLLGSQLGIQYVVDVAALNRSSRRQRCCCCCYTHN